MRSMLLRFTGLALLWSITGGPVAAQEGLSAATVQRAREAVARVSATTAELQASAAPGGVASALHLGERQNHLQANRFVP